MHSGAAHGEFGVRGGEVLPVLFVSVLVDLGAAAFGVIHAVIGTGLLRDWPGSIPAAIVLPLIGGTPGVLCFLFFHTTTSRNDPPDKNKKYPQGPVGSRQ
ncbi:hypothetical protein [Actinocorallia lasiicapitis]